MGVLPLHEHPPHTRRSVPLRFVGRVRHGWGAGCGGRVQEVAEIFDAIWRWLPLFGITFLALINSAWMLLVRSIYACIDKENLSNVATGLCAFFGFIVSLLGQFYVLPYRETAPPAALFVLATGASASPLLIYLLYRAFKPNACQ
jgi:hypothetical protein